jgi:hypothetical protein
MGLLDDAIRDHLELKRRRGADPSEVEREQHEALDPPAGQATEQGSGAPAGTVDVAGPATAGDAATEVQETEEIDMKAVLEEDSEERHAASAPIAAEAGSADVLEETPEFLRETPEQDRLWFEQRSPRDFDFDR